MNITLDKQDENHASLEIVLTEEDYRPKVTAKVKEYGKRVQLKGFRPGKVPPGLIRKMYGRSILIEEVNELLSQGMSDYIREQKLGVVGEPVPDVERQEQIDWDNQKEFAFRFQLGLIPEFTYDPAAVQVTRYAVEVTEEQVDETIERMRDHYGEEEEVEEADEETTLTGVL
ncbi:MAG: trigger factor family protein, partial [Catalinimonas sp.]